MKQLTALVFACQIAAPPALAGPTTPPPWLACALAQADKIPVLKMNPDNAGSRERFEKDLRALNSAEEQIIARCEPPAPAYMSGQEQAQRILDRLSVRLAVIDRLAARSRNWLSKTREQNAIRRNSI